MGVDDGMWPLPQLFPLDRSFLPEAAGAFFGGSFPEGVQREALPGDWVITITWRTRLHSLADIALPAIRTAP